jgi:hypothetical protein
MLGVDDEVQPVTHHFVQRSHDESISEDRVVRTASDSDRGYRSQQ